MHNKFFSILFILKISISIIVATKRFHEHLSTEELRNIFHVQSLSDVPEYEVTSIRSRVRRSSTSHIRTIHLEAFGQKRILNMRPNEHLSKNVPVYFADATSDGTSGIKLSSVPLNEDIGIPYQDEYSRAAVLISHHPDSGALLLDGTVGEELVIRPIPYSLNSIVPNPREEEPSQNDLYDDEAFLDGDGENIEDDLVFSDGLPLIPDDESVQGSSISAGVHKKLNGTTEKLPDGLLLLRKRRSSSTLGYHVVYKRKAPIVDSDYALLESDELVADTNGENRRKKRDAPFVIYPEILVLVDYDGYLLHGQDNSKIKSYYVSFWNGADLRYKLLKSPKVKVSIAGIIISRSRDAMPYLERNRVGRDSIDSASALTDMGKYLYQERRLPTYDVAVAITKLDMCRRPLSGGECNRGTAGFAYVGGACVVNKRLQKVNSVAIVEDTGGFSGIIVAAHEVGHLLGAVHDGSPPPSYLGGPGARRCRWKDGYIMSDLRHTEKGFRWSTCTVEQFHHFLNGQTATCLYNLPHEDESLPRILPGKLMSLDAQCRKDRGTSACFKDDRVCAQLFCFDKSTGYCVSYRPAAEGSDCGDGKICRNGKCVYDEDNTITDLDIHRIDTQLSESEALEPSKSSRSLDIVIFSHFKNDIIPARKDLSTTIKQDNYALFTTSTPKTTPPTTKKPTTYKQIFTTKSNTFQQSTTNRPKSTTRRSNTAQQYTTTAQSTTTSTDGSRNYKNNKIQTYNPYIKYDVSDYWKTTAKQNISPKGLRSQDIRVTTFRPPFNSRYTFSSKTTAPPTIHTTTKKTKHSTLMWTRWLTSSKSPPISWPHSPQRTSAKGRTESTTVHPITAGFEKTPEQRSHFWNNKWKKTKRTTKRRTTTPVYTTSTTTTTQRTTTKHINRISDEKTSKKSFNVVEHDFKCNDKLKKIAGGLSCKRFLESYGYRYCDHRYIHKNCCRSRAEVCA